MCGTKPVSVADLGLPDAELLAAVADRLLTVDPADLPAAVALERTRALLLHTERLRTAALVAVRDLDARELYALDGAGNASVWLARERVGGRAAPLSVARRLGGHQVVGDALAAGSLDVLGAERVCAALVKLPEQVDEPVVASVLSDGVAQLLQEQSGGADPDPQATARVLAEAAAAVDAALPERVEPVFVLLAQRLAPGLLARTLSLLVDALLPEEHLQRWEDAQAQTYLDVRELMDGYADVKGVLDPETAVALRRALARRSLAVRRQGGDGLTAGQRRVLALRQVLRDAGVRAGLADDDVAEDDDEAADQVPTAVEEPERCDLAGAEQQQGRQDVLEQDAAEPDAVDQDGVDPAAAETDAVEQEPHLAAASPPTPPAADGAGVELVLVTREPARLTDDDAGVPLLAGVDAVLGLPGALPGRFGPGLATSLPVEAVRRLGCGGHLSAVLLDAYGTPIGASGTHRHATRRERQALLAQWGGTCATDGCGRPGVIPHHVEPWWLTHRTRLKDLVPYCDGCHHDLHEGGRTIRLRNGRWISPTGWTSPPEDTQDAG